MFSPPPPPPLLLVLLFSLKDEFSINIFAELDEFTNPPPYSAAFLEILQFLIYIIPLFFIAPPLIARQFLIFTFSRETEALELYIPPPDSETFPPVTVIFLITIVFPALDILKTLKVLGDVGYVP